MDKLIVPILGKSYVSFKKELLLWQDVTSLEPEKRAVLIVLKLPDKAKEIALQIPREELKGGVERQVDGNSVKITGIERLTEELDKVYLEDIEKERYQAYEDFRQFKRDSKMSVHEYLLEFDKRVKTLAEYEIKLPDSVLAYEILNNANLSCDQVALARATVEKLDYNLMKDQIKKITIDKHPSHVLSEDFKVKVEKEDEALFTEGDEEDEMNSTYYGRGNRYNSYNRGSYDRSQDGYQQRSSRTRGPGYHNNPVNQKAKKTNPRDRYGNHLVCHVCRSIYHFAQNCPDKDLSYSTFYQDTEDIALFQNAPQQKSNIETMKGFTRDNFNMAVLDTGCNISVCGKEWLEAYVDGLTKEKRRRIKKDSSGVNFRFGDNPSKRSLEKVTIPAVINNKSVMIQTQVVDADIPLLLSKEAMRKANMIIDMGNDTVTAYGVTKPLHFTKSGHYSIRLNNYTMDETCLRSKSNCVLFNERDEDKIEKHAEKLHKQFAHPSAEKLKSFVKTGGVNRKEVFEAIERVSEKCNICRRYKSYDKDNKEMTAPARRELDNFEAARQFMLNDIEEDDSSEPVSSQVASESEPHIEDNDEPTRQSYSEECYEDKQQKFMDVKAELENKKTQVVIEKKDPFAKEKGEELRKWVDNEVYSEEIAMDSPEIQESDIYPISVTWVTTDKGYKRKARLVARGYFNEVLENTETVSPTCRQESLRLLFTVISSKSWQLKSLDIASAFL